MKAIYFITGTSSGIGKSLVKELLGNSENHIFGFSRLPVSFKNERYVHQQIDLSKQENLVHFTFPKVKSFEKLVLINNACLLAPINYVGKQNNQELADLLTVNLIAPSILTNIFLNTFPTENETKVILNIGSGAAHFPYDGWSAYCSSKSGLHTYTNVLKKELERENRKNTHVFYTLPGVVDTKMQNMIRTQSDKNFSYKEKFVELYENNLLVQPSQTAKDLLKIIKNPKEYNTLFNLKKSS